MGVQNLTPNIKPSPWPVDLAHIERSARRFWDELKVAIIFMDGSLAFDSVSGKFLPKTGIVTSVQGRYGNGLICGDDTGFYTILAGTFDHGGPFTVLTLIKRIADLAAGDNKDNSIMRTASGGVFNVYINNSTPTNSNSFSFSADTDDLFGPIPPLNQPVVAGVKYDGTTATVLFDGTDDVSGPHTQASETTATFFMNRASPTNRAVEDAEVYGIYVWQRVLAPSEILFLSRVDFFAPVRPARNTFGFVAVVGGGLSIPTAMYSYRRRRVA